jgi:hypothetical protein
MRLVDGVRWLCLRTINGTMGLEMSQILRCRCVDADTTARKMVSFEQMIM